MTALRNASPSGKAPPALRQAPAQCQDPIHQRAFLAKERVHFHRRLVLRFAVRFREFDPLVEPDREFRLGRLPALGHAHRISARHHAGPTNTGVGDLRRRRHAGRFFAHAPDNAIQSGPLAGRQLIHHPTGRIQHLDFHLAEEMARALVIGNNGCVGRIVPDESGAAACPAALRINALLHGTRRYKERLLSEQIGGKRTQRSDVVNDPDASSVRSQDEVVLPRMNRQVAHRHRRETASLELRPGLAAIDRNKEPELRAEEEQVLLDEVLLDDVGVAANAFGILRIHAAPSRSCRNRWCDKRTAPCRPTCGDRTRRKRCRRRNCSPAPSSPTNSWQALDVSDDVAPGLAAIARELNVAIVRPRPR